MADRPDPPLATGDRLQKVLARIGVGSRRVCEELIADGRVTVNGEVPVLGRRVDPDVDRVELDGVPLPIQPGLVYYLLNKPTGVVSTAEDTHHRPTVVSLVPDRPRVFPVGRLDMDTEGLLILTNDGELTHRLTHPSFGVPKEYLVQLDGAPTPGEVRRLRDGRGARRRAHQSGAGGGGRPRPTPDRHPRRAQPADPPHGRGGGAHGDPTGADPDRAGHRSVTQPRVAPAADPGRGTGPGRGGDTGGLADGSPLRRQRAPGAG